MADEQEENIAASTRTTLERRKRAVIRAINCSRTQVPTLLTKNPSEELVLQISAYLDSYSHDLDELKEIDLSLLELMDVSKIKSLEALERAESDLTKDFASLRDSYHVFKGKLGALAAHVGKEERNAQTASRQSLNTSLLNHESSIANPLAKLPDIHVPKFNGKLGNFTEWFSLFTAMVDSNESMRPIQKLYYLKQAMVDGAASLLKDYPLTEGMYEPAFTYVKERYYNKRAIIAEHFREILDTPAIQVTNLRETLDKLQATVRGLKTCGLDTAKMSLLIAFIVVRKLPDSLRADWENSNFNYSTYPSFEPLTQFLSNRCFAYEAVDFPRKTTANPKPASGSGTTKSDSTKPKSSFATTQKPAQLRSCICCSGEQHYLSQCPVFEKKSVEARLDFVISNQLCRNCLRPGHAAKNCNSSACRTCGGKHNTKLHREHPVGSPRNTHEAEASTSDNRASLSMVKQQASIVLLPCAVVKVHIGRKEVLARALIDSCSQVNLVTEAFIKRNRIKKFPSSTNIIGVSASAVSSQFAASLTTRSQYEDEISFKADIIGSIPYRANSKTLKIIQQADADLNFADRGLDSSTVDILIGAEFASRILLGQKRFIGDICLQKSTFGWIVEGPLEKSHSFIPRHCFLSVAVEDALSKFWEVEEVNPPKIALHEHELCENHFESTYSRLQDGRFQIRLPFKSSTLKLANTYRQARCALLRGETNLNNKTRSQYIDFMKEYCDLGHMKLVDRSTDSVARFFIPHLPVIRPESSTTKLRVVFNASAKCQGQNSLNETLMNGPTLQPEIVDILIKFRTYPVAFSADVSKMYRQIVVHPQDRRFQSILWRDNTKDSINTYELTTLTYGTTPAAYIATKCLQILAKETHKVDPEVSNAMAKEFYMDDLLTGSNDVKSAISKASKIHAVLRSAKFPLRKFVSNSKELLKSLEPDLVEELRPVSFSSTGLAKISGLQWCPAEDEFRISTHTKDLTEVKLTKRSVASMIASVFDPLGLVNPILIRGKILLQDLWREGLEWDDPIPEKLEKDFRDYYLDLRNLPKFCVTRSFSKEKCEFDLFGFSDASNKAYGAVVYIKPLVAHARPVIVCSKSKVAPVKISKVPRLELLGTVLLTNLMSRVSKVLDYDISKAKVFCDSTIVLAWLKGPAAKYETFVRNRIDFVTSILPDERWQYVKTTENPADLLTRGISVQSLLNNQLWLNGPPWLGLNSRSTFEVALPMEVPETRKTYVSFVTGLEFDERIISLSSSYDRLIRIITLALKFISHSLARNPDTITTDQIISTIYRISQVAWFQTEMNMLRNHAPISTRSSLSSLDPFLDEHGLLRIGGRLRNSIFSYDVKHPIILHAKSTLATLLARHVHEKYFHATQAFVLSFLQRKFWLVNGGASLVKRTIRNCVWCTRMKAETVSQIMGDLPRDRTIIARPFTISGCDFAGPFTIKCTNHRTMKYLKHYAAFFVCLVTRAVHIESVSDLSATAFMAAFQRFVAR